MKPIPGVPYIVPPSVAGVLNALKENVEIITGQRGGKIDPLPVGATTAEIIAKINEILGRIQ